MDPKKFVGGVPWEGDLPGVVGDDLRKLPSEAYEEGDDQRAPPLPKNFPAQTLADYVLAEAKKIDALVENKYVRSKILKLWRILTSHQFLAVHQVPWETAPFRSIPLQAIATDAAGNNAYEDICTMSVDRGFYGVVRWVGHDTVNTIEGSTALGDVWAAATLLWRIGIRPSAAAADSAVQPYNGFNGFFRQIGQIEDPTPVPYLFIPPAMTVAFQASGPAGVVSNLSARMMGWQFPIEDVMGGAFDAIFGTR